MSQAFPRPTIGLSQLLIEAGLDAGSAIRVTGPGALPALIWLCRRGYENVGCLQAGARAPADEADALSALTRLGQTAMLSTIVFVLLASVVMAPLGRR